MSPVALFSFLVCVGMTSAFYQYPAYNSYQKSYYSSAPSPYYGQQSSYYSAPSPYYSRGPYYRDAQESGSGQETEVAPVAAVQEQQQQHYVSVVSAPSAQSHYNSAPASYVPCPAPVPEIKPYVFQSQKPIPYTYGLPLAPQVLEHHAAPSIINYYSQPWVVKHTSGAVLNAYTQKPVVVDHYSKPTVHEAPGPQAVVVEEVCPPAEGVEAGPAGYYPAPA